MKKSHNPHFFSREPDGSVKIRLNISPELATLIEEAAGNTPLMTYMYKTLETQARTQVERRTKRGSN